MQRNNRLGCLTSTGIFATLITVLIIVGVAYARGGWMYTPGALNAQPGETLGGVNSHADLSEQCDACHSAPWSSVTMADLCVDCHGEVAAQMQNMVSVHGTMYDRNPALECRDCHPEHNGVDAPLVNMSEGEFPHELLGFSLTGHRLTARNEAFVCSDCHGNEISSFASFTCDTCHREIDSVFTQNHIQSFGEACLDCHDGVDSLGEDFDHSAFEFKLTGRHQEPACAKCHTDARKLADFQNAPQDCYSCHRVNDAHRGRFGTDCGLCHSPNGWEPANFNHDSFSFKLEGKHKKVKCEECHQNNVFQGTPTNCYSCHERDDEHNGQFGTDCGACHNPSDWDNATFDHNLSNFPLDGAHANVACEQCHTNGQFTEVSSQCVTCHADPEFHLGAFSSNCMECHSTSAWTPASFSLSHPQPRVHEGGTGVNHGRTSCRTCHPSTVQSYTCLACHSNNQGGEGGFDD